MITAPFQAALEALKNGTAFDSSFLAPVEQTELKSLLMSWKQEFVGIRYWRLENAELACQFIGAGQIGYLLSGDARKER